MIYYENVDPELRAQHNNLNDAQKAADIEHVVYHLTATILSNSILTRCCHRDPARIPEEERMTTSERVVNCPQMERWK